MIRQSSRGSLSGSGVIARVVNGNLAASTLPGGIRRLVEELLGRIAWELQTRQKIQLDARLQEILDQVRGRREVPLDQLKAYALETKILAPSDEDGVGFVPPGSSPTGAPSIPAPHRPGFHRTRRHHGDARPPQPRPAVGGHPRAARRDDGFGRSADPADHRRQQHELRRARIPCRRCIHEAELAKGSRTAVQDDVIAQVLDSLVWRSTPMKESSASVRIRATESLALLKHPPSVPHLVSLAVERVRPTFTGQPTFELSGPAACRAAGAPVDADGGRGARQGQAAGKFGTPEGQALGALIDAWRKGIRRRCGSSTRPPASKVFRPSRCSRSARSAATRTAPTWPSRSSILTRPRIPSGRLPIAAAFRSRHRYARGSHANARDAGPARRRPT